MIVLDTNIISAVMRGPNAPPEVLAWLRELEERPVTTVINRAEIMAGISLLPAGARRDRLFNAAQSAFSTLGSTLPLTPEAADAYGAVLQKRTVAGAPISTMDALIAAICLTSGATLATRNVRDFRGLGLNLINPWLRSAP